jgi:hypothetical protein
VLPLHRNGSESLAEADGGQDGEAVSALKCHVAELSSANKDLECELGRQVTRVQHLQVRCSYCEWVLVPMAACLVHLEATDSHMRLNFAVTVLAQLENDDLRMEIRRLKSLLQASTPEATKRGIADEVATTSSDWAAFGPPDQGAPPVPFNGAFDPFSISSGDAQPPALWQSDAFCRSSLSNASPAHSAGSPVKPVGFTFSPSHSRSASSTAEAFDSTSQVPHSRSSSQAELFDPFNVAGDTTTAFDAFSLGK